MSLVFFRGKRFGSEAHSRIDECNAIIEEYQADGLKLTLRQLYYQLVTKNVIPNEERSYKNLGKLLSEARLAGLVDWEAIEDRTRLPKVPTEFVDLQELAEGALDAYRLPRWEGQANYVELWVEKDALAGVLAPIARKYHVTLMVNRGYSSQSAMYEAATRYKRACGGDEDGDGSKKPVLLYLGDLDPSGEDMTRDIKDRFAMFDMNLVVHKIALTIEEVRMYDPPPNPAKVTDSRAAKYIAKYGESSWEVDALPPKVLTRMISSEIEELLDRSLWAEVIRRENRDKERLMEAVADIMRGKKT